VQLIFTLTTQMEDRARNAAAAYKDARALVDKLKAANNPPPMTLLSSKWRPWRRWRHR
jgi:hypothetical protein